MGITLNLLPDLLIPWVSCSTPNFSKLSNCESLWILAKDKNVILLKSPYLAHLWLVTWNKADFVVDTMSLGETVSLSRGIKLFVRVINGANNSFPCGIPKEKRRSV